MYRQHRQQKEAQAALEEASRAVPPPSVSVTQQGRWCQSERGRVERKGKRTGREEVKPEKEVPSNTSHRKKTPTFCPNSADINVLNKTRFQHALLLQAPLPSSPVAELTLGEIRRPVLHSPPPLVQKSPADQHQDWKDDQDQQWEQRQRLRRSDGNIACGEKANISSSRANSGDKQT